MGKSKEILFRPCSWLFSTAVRMRHLLYDYKFLTQKKAPLPVISIGNVVAGGAGKTQVALLLAELLSQEMSVAILSRGYKGKAEHAKEPLLVNAATQSPELCGDEPWMLASRLSSVPIYVNKDRYKSALVAKKAGAQLAILDDGMQHRKLQRDFEIVVLDGNTSLKHFLPLGPLREQLHRLHQANLLLFIEKPDSISEQLSAFASIPQVVTKIRSLGIFDLKGKPLPSIQGLPVALFCAIGNPLRFLRSVEELGARVVFSHFYPDHQTMTQEALEKMALRAQKKGARLLVCTEKDKVKLSFSSTHLPMAWVRVKLEVIQNQEAWVKAVDEIKSFVSRYP